LLKSNVEICCGKKKAKRKIIKAITKYAKVYIEKSRDEKLIDYVAMKTIKGEYGCGEDRRKRLESAGFHYNVIQDRVNKICLGEATNLTNQFDCGIIIAYTKKNYLFDFIEELFESNEELFYSDEIPLIIPYEMSKREANDLGYFRDAFTTWYLSKDPNISNDIILVLPDTKFESVSTTDFNGLVTHLIYSKKFLALSSISEE
jgi:hypothetical protein